MMLRVGRYLKSQGTADADTLWKAMARVAEDPGVAERLEWMRGRIEDAGGALAAAGTVKGVL